MKKHGLADFIDLLPSVRSAPRRAKRGPNGTVLKAEKAQKSVRTAVELAFSDQVEYNSIQERRHPEGRFQPPAHKPDGKRGPIPDEVPKGSPLTSAYEQAAQLSDSEKLTLVRAIMTDFAGDKTALQALALEFAAPAHGAKKSAHHASARPLREDPEFIQFVKDNLWETRRERGIPWRKDVFEFITETYGLNTKAGTDWIGRGMVQPDIKDAGDDALYMALARHVTKHGRPADFILPTLSDAVLTAISDQRERQFLVQAREVDRVRRSRHRAGLK